MDAIEIRATVRQMLTDFDNLTPSQQLNARIQAAFAAGKRVWIATHTRTTEYRPKHAAMIKASSRDGDTGVYVQSGKRWTYALPSTVIIEGEAR